MSVKHRNEAYRTDETASIANLQAPLACSDCDPARYRNRWQGGIRWTLASVWLPRVPVGSALCLAGFESG